MRKTILGALFLLALNSSSFAQTASPPLQVPAPASAPPAPSDDTKITMTWGELKDLIQSQLALVEAQKKANAAAEKVNAQLTAKQPPAEATTAK